MVDADIAGQRWLCLAVSGYTCFPERRFLYGRDKNGWCAKKENRENDQE